MIAILMAAATNAGPAVVDAGAPAMVSVAILTEPVGAAVFVDDELAGPSPATVPLAAGRTVRIRAEHPGRAPAENSHVVGDRAEAFRLALALLADATPTDAARTPRQQSVPTGDCGLTPAGYRR